MNNIKKWFGNFISFLKKNLLLCIGVVLVVISLAAISCAVYIKHQENTPIKNADSTMKLSSKDKSWFKGTYKNDKLLPIVEKGWNGRVKDSVLTINDNKITDQDKNSDKSIVGELASSVAGVSIRPNGLPNKARTLFGTNKVETKNKESNANSSKQTNLQVKTVQNENKNGKNILKGVYLIKPEYMNRNSLKSTITIMTDSAEKEYLENEQNIIDKAKSIKKPIMYNVTPVYKNDKDMIPVGFAVSGCSYDKLPQTSVNDKNQLVHKDGKIGDYQFNYYIKNVQEGYKVNYSNGKVMLNNDK